LGFTRKNDAKKSLGKNFAEPEDYTILQIYDKICEEKETRGGFNKEQILMKVDTFKAFCLIAKTKKGKEIRNYFLKLEETLHETLDEESNELLLQIEEQKVQLIEQKEMSEKEKQQVLQQTLINQFPINTLCVYFGITDNVDEKGQTLLKFGISNNFYERLIAHLKTYTNFKIVNVFRVKNHIEIENCISKSNLTIRVRFAHKKMKIFLFMFKI
jgi:phage anti-repressor protein